MAVGEIPLALANQFVAGEEMATDERDEAGELQILGKLCVSCVDAAAGSAV